MDSYNLKRENRKKFQNKEALKKKHSTPSDKKYRKLNKSAEIQNDDSHQDTIELESNDYRYQDHTITNHNEDSDTVGINNILKRVLKDRKDHIIEKDSKITRMNINHMDVNSLNTLLANDSQIQGNSSETTMPKSNVASRVLSKSEPSNKDFKVLRNTTSFIPKELSGDQEFLDSLI